MTEKVHEAPIDQGQIKRALRIFYLALFLYTFLSQVSEVFYFDNPLSTSLLEKGAQLNKIDLAAGTFYYGWANIVKGCIILLYLVIALHATRIYLSLDVMEDNKYSNYEIFTDSGPKFRIVEFACRLSIIVIVTGKILGPSNFLNFITFTSIFYFSIVVWSIVASFNLYYNSTTRPHSHLIWSWENIGYVERQTFIISSIFGFFGSLAMFVLVGGFHEIFSIVSIVGLTLLSIFLLINLLWKEISIFHFGKQFIEEYRGPW
jgi:hypothetical protein